jgi:hypothetical protein
LKEIRVERSILEDLLPSLTFPVCPYYQNTTNIHASGVWVGVGQKNH